MKKICNYFKSWFNRAIPEVKVYICPHDYKLIDDWSSDALGMPYGYKIYKCSKCEHVDKRFWYI